MKYYVVSDVHGFYTQMETALREKGFFNDTEPHKLIICGDLLDRGKEAVKAQNFALELLHKDDLIFIRGNHEDLMVDMLNNFEKYKSEISWGYSHHVSNGTYDSALQLSNMDEYKSIQNSPEFVTRTMLSPYYKELIPASVNYFETSNYIFVHGWIPCLTENIPAFYRKNRHYEFNPDWRDASNKDWEIARWFNGIDLAELHSIVERGKQIVCGHWHTSFGHSKLEQRCSEFGSDADFSPYYSKNIIAIDACTAHSGLVNCIVIEDEI